MNWFLLKTGASKEDVERSLAIDGGYDARIDPDDYHLEQIDSDELIGDTLPPIVQQHLVIELDGEYIRIDFEDVMNLVNYLPEKPIVCCQLLLKLQVALTNLYFTYRDKHEYAEESLKVYEAERYKLYSSKDVNENPYAEKMKLTRESIDALIRAEDNWRLLKQDERQASINKGLIWEAREYVQKTYNLCLEYLKKLDDVEAVRTVTDRTFRETVVNVATSTITIEDEE